MDSAGNLRLDQVKSTMDEGWAWKYVLAAFVMRLIYDGLLFSIGIFHESLYEYYGASSAKTSLVSSILFGINFICGPFATCLVSRFGCRKVSASGSLIATAGLLLSLAAPRIEYLYITIGLLCGFGIGLMNFSSVAIIGYYFEKKRGTAMGLQFSSTGFGPLIFAPLTAGLTQYYGFWKGPMLILSGLMLNCGVLSLLFDESGPTSKKVTEADVDALPAITTPTSPKDYITSATQTDDDGVTVQETDKILNASQNTASTFAMQATTSAILLRHQNRCFTFTDRIGDFIDLSVFSNYVYLIFSFTNFVFSLGIRTPFVYIAHLAVEQGLATERQSGYVLALIGVSNTLGILTFGFLADRTSIKRLYIFTAILLINGLANFTTSFITQFYQMALYCTVFGVTFGGLSCLSPVVLVELLGIQKLNTCYGLLGLTSGIAITFGTPLTGLLYDQTHSYKQGFNVSGGFIVSSGFLLFLIPFVQKRYPQQYMT